MTAVQSSVLGIRILASYLSGHPLFCKQFMPICYYGRCCEYALLTLEYWADAPEIHCSADLYEDLIKSCVADAMSEVLRLE